jgi:DcaP outer membrane protein
MPTSMVRPGLFVCLTACMLVAASATPTRAGQAEAQGQPNTTVQGRAQDLDAAVAELRKMLAEQRDALAAQGKLIEAQARQMAALEQRLDATSAVALTARNEVADLKKQPAVPTVPSAVEKRLEEVERAVQRVPEITSDDLLSTEHFPRSIRIPGTDSAFRIGGQARMTLVHTLGPLGTDDRFITSSIPVPDQVAGDDARTNYSAQASRANLDLRTPSRIGALRTFIEGDFAGSSSTLRLRHAFMQIRNLIVGQTWSTFSDPEAEPLGIDFEGLNAISLFRQPQVRYTRPLTEGLNVALALENPNPDLTGAQGVNLTPDFITRVRWQPKEDQRLLRTEHVQAALLFRALRGQVTTLPDVTLSTGGFGGNVSGVIAPRWDPDDRVKFAVNAGWGIGRYITDLGTLGGQDAVYDATSDSLRALPVSSGYFGYERMWRRTFTSTFTYGIVNVENLDIQPDDSLKRTQRATINLTWTPTPQTDIVLEFLAGTRVNKDGERGSSSQIQAGWTFRF